MEFIKTNPVTAILLIATAITLLYVIYRIIQVKIETVDLDEDKTTVGREHGPESPKIEDFEGAKGQVLIEVKKDELIESQNLESSQPRGDKPIFTDTGVDVDIMIHEFFENYFMTRLTNTAISRLQNTVTGLVEHFTVSPHHGFEYTSKIRGSRLANHFLQEELVELQPQHIDKAFYKLANEVNNLVENKAFTGVVLNSQTNKPYSVIRFGNVTYIQIMFISRFIDPRTIQNKLR
jgi:hypothetical protein